VSAPDDRTAPVETVFRLTMPPSCLGRTADTRPIDDYSIGLDGKASKLRRLAKAELDHFRALWRMALPRQLGPIQVVAHAHSRPAEGQSAATLLPVRQLGLRLRFGSAVGDVEQVHVWPPTLGRNIPKEDTLRQILVEQRRWHQAAFGAATGQEQRSEQQARGHIGATLSGAIARLPQLSSIGKRNCLISQGRGSKGRHYKPEARSGSSGGL
jgi:hypothetical protein